MDKTLWHEVVHAVLKDMKNPLESNEKFVDEFAKRLHSMKLSGLDKK